MVVSPPAMDYISPSFQSCTYQDIVRLGPISTRISKWTAQKVSLFVPFMLVLLTRPIVLVCLCFSASKVPLYGFPSSVFIIKGLTLNVNQPYSLFSIMVFLAEPPLFISKRRVPLPVFPCFYFIYKVVNYCPPFLKWPQPLLLCAVDISIKLSTLKKIFKTFQSSILKFPYLFSCAALCCWPPPTGDGRVSVRALIASRFRVFSSLPMLISIFHPRGSNLLVFSLCLFLLKSSFHHLSKLIIFISSFLAYVHPNNPFLD